MVERDDNNVGSGQPLPLMIEALGFEIAAIKKSGGSTTVELFGGVFVAESNGNFIYRLPEVPRESESVTADPVVEDGV